MAQGARTILKALLLELRDSYFRDKWLMNIGLGDDSSIGIAKRGSVD